MWLFAEYRSVALTLSYPPPSDAPDLLLLQYIRPDPK